MILRQFCRRCLRLLSSRSVLTRENRSLSYLAARARQNRFRNPTQKRTRRALPGNANDHTFFRCCSIFGASDTVFALSSGHGRCGVAVVRVTGPQSRQCLLELTGMSAVPKPRQAVLRKIRDPLTGDTIDHGLILWFPGPHSFTGEDCVEFQVHGGPAVVMAMMTALGRIPNCTHAQPGDFTRRAFLNGKLELTEVEGLADLIHAETEAQRKQALRQMEGDLGRLYADWTQRVLKSVAHVEAVIDFGEDENIEEGILDEVRENVEALVSEISAHLRDGRRGERLRSGVHVAILGAPNAGKSSLLNILCQRPAAIVSPHAGTTRDVVESALDIGGYPVVLCDTAGLRHTTDPVEQEGVRRALSRVESADLRILIADVSVVADRLANTSCPLSLPQLGTQLLHSATEVEGSCSNWTEKALSYLTPSDTIIVFNKTDLSPHITNFPGVKRSLQLDSTLDSYVCWISCKTEDGIQHFIEVLTKQLKQMCGNPLAGSPSMTQARHRHHLSLCLQLLNTFLSLHSMQDDVVLDQAAEELRMAMREIGRVTGQVGVEEILDVVFRDFCIGK